MQINTLLSLFKLKSVSYRKHRRKQATQFIKTANKQFEDYLFANNPGETTFHNYDIQLINLKRSQKPPFGYGESYSKPLHSGCVRKYSLTEQYPDQYSK